MITSLKQSLLTHTHTHNHLSYDPNRTGIKQGGKKERRKKLELKRFFNCYTKTLQSNKMAPKQNSVDQIVLFTES